MTESMKKKGIVLVFVGLFVVIVGAGGYILLHFMDAPASASDISAGASSPAQSGQSLSLGSPVRVTGTYADFSYPSIFTALKSQAPTGNIVVEYGYEHYALIPWQLNISIQFLPGGEVSNDSAYSIMAQDPARYSKSTQTSNGNQVVVFADTTAGGFSKIAFMFHDSYAADVSLTSEDGQYLAEEQSALNQVVQSWQWN